MEVTDGCWQISLVLITIGSHWEGASGHVSYCDSAKNMCTDGRRQSPIDINPLEVEDIQLTPLSFSNHWSSDICLSMFQGGNTVIVKPNGAEPLILCGGPVSGAFILDQLHFHWGSSPNNGSEHSLDGCKYAMEAHFVYYNSIYGCPQRALNEPEGILILAVLMESKPVYYNREFDNIVGLLYKLNCPGNIVPLTRNVFNIFKEIMTSREYYTYEGSLTTPPCYEDVTWIVYKYVVCLHHHQVAPFRKITNRDGRVICSNCRSTQPLNCRLIFDVMSKCP